MSKKYLKIDVLTAARERIKVVFDYFEKIYLSFSGGKDSSVMMHLAIEEAKKRKRQIGILYVDFEAQYQETIKHIEEMTELYREWIELYWIALPIALRNATSVYQPKWLCWDPDVEWIRQPHKKSITDINYFEWFIPGMEFEELVPEFGRWYSKGKLTACLVGIRADESLNRYRTIVRENKTKFHDFGWTTQIDKFKTNCLFNAYPIYDWRTQDIWIFNGKFNYPYNKLYEYMHQAGVSISQQRICQPYGDDQRKGLWLYHLIEPETWGKVVARVSGANFGALYAKNSGNILGNIKIEKPEGKTWQEFYKILINSLPEVTAAHFKQKILVFINWYKRRGYPDGIPDFEDKKLEAAKKVPSWRRICKAILKNDYWCKSLSFAQTKSYSYRKHSNSFNPMHWKGGMK